MLMKAILNNTVTFDRLKPLGAYFSRPQGNMMSAEPEVRCIEVDTEDIVFRWFCDAVVS